MKHRQIVIDVLEDELKRLAFDANMYRLGVSSQAGKRNFERRIKIIEAIQEIRAEDMQIRMELV